MSKGKRTRRERPADVVEETATSAVSLGCEVRRACRGDLLALYKVGRTRCCVACMPHARKARENHDREVAIVKAFPQVYRPELLELEGKAPFLAHLERQLAGSAIA
jgi:hypothetical protein